MANVLWADAHVKASKPVIPTVQYNAWSVDTYKSNNVGDLMAPASQGGDQDYYFTLTK